MKTHSVNGTASAQFLIAEYNALQARAINLEEIKSGRLNFFLLIAGAIVAALSAFRGDSIFGYGYRSGVFLSAMILLLLGILTLKNSIDYSIAIVLLHRRAGRMRRWFVDHDESIKKYVAFEAADDRPRLKMPTSLLAWRGAEPVLLIINVISVSVASAIAISFFRSEIFPWIGGAIAALLGWFFQNWYIARKLIKQERDEKKHALFPFQPESE